MNEKLEKAIDEIVSKSEKLIKIVCSGSLDSEYNKVVFRRIEKDRFLSEKYTRDKVFHETIEPDEIEKCLKTRIFGGFKQYDVMFTDGGLIILTNKKGTVTVKENKVKTVMDAVHNRKKNYIFTEGEDIPALKDLGVFTKENKIVAAKSEKFKQINRFIEIVDDVFRKNPINEGESFNVLDFGCGKSYLTFLLYYYLSVKRKLNVKITGYDLKADVVKKCNELADKYGYNGLKFIVADVKEDKLSDEKIDMIVTLHACDTATDYALDFAVEKEVKYIFSVPCCQHEINAEIRKGGDFDIMLEHGLIKERFSALLTDAIRVKALENAGYSVDCLEFVGFDASPKNLMIRASLAMKEDAAEREKQNEKLECLLDKYGASQTLLGLMKSEGRDGINRR